MMNAYGAIVRRRDLSQTFTPASSPSKWLSGGPPAAPFAPTLMIQMEPLMTMNCTLCQTTGLKTLKHYRHGRKGGAPCTFDCCKRTAVCFNEMQRRTAPGLPAPVMTTGVWLAMEHQSNYTMDAALVREQEQDWYPDMPYLSDDRRYHQYPNLVRRPTILQLYNATGDEYKRDMTNYYLEDPANFKENLRQDGCYYTQYQFDTRRTQELAQTIVHANPVLSRQKFESGIHIRAINQANYNLYQHFLQHGLGGNAAEQVRRLLLITALAQARNNAQVWLAANP